jgi:hypothetical protein
MLLQVYLTLLLISNVYPIGKILKTIDIRDEKPGYYVSAVWTDISKNIINATESHGPQGGLMFSTDNQPSLIIWSGLPYTTGYVHGAIPSLYRMKLTKDYLNQNLKMEDLTMNQIFNGFKFEGRSDALSSIIYDKQQNPYLFVFGGSHWSNGMLSYTNSMVNSL